ncbi:hypothetical protein ACIPSA_30315 [Streptomyces sp. NPDC086549]|uniref:hypothetical protein n=1 Tax=Streptomyces sp. NPDC086549 TaxID=3365752 RepID=UPI003830C114
MTTSSHLASHLAADVLDAHWLPAAFGVPGVGVVVFAGTCLLVAAAVGAPARARSGYLSGREAAGPRIHRSRSWRSHEGVKHAENLLKRYAHAKAVVVARFIPVVRTC